MIDKKNRQDVLTVLFMRNWSPLFGEKQADFLLNGTTGSYLSPLVSFSDKISETADRSSPRM